MYAKLESLPKAVLIELMVEAISEMQAYNGRSITAVIAEAMGAKFDEDGRVWRLPSNAKIVKRFEMSE